jgi:hypothetical protein
VASPGLAAWGLADIMHRECSRAAGAKSRDTPLANLGTLLQKFCRVCISRDAYIDCRDVV